MVNVTYDWKKRLAATASADGTAQLWETNNDCNISTILSGHQCSLFMTTFNADGTQLATCSEDGTVRLWSVQCKSGKIFAEQYQILEHPSTQPFSVAFGGSTLFAACRDGSCVLWSKEHILKD